MSFPPGTFALGDPSLEMFPDDPHPLVVLQVQEREAQGVTVTWVQIAWITHSDYLYSEKVSILDAWCPSARKARGGPLDKKNAGVIGLRSTTGATRAMWCRVAGPTSLKHRPRTGQDKIVNLTCIVRLKEEEWSLIRDAINAEIDRSAAQAP